MATQETKQLDEIISSRRAMMMLGGTALAGLALTSVSKAQAAAPTDNDILNFALNLEYLEGEFYTLATTGKTLGQSGIGIGAGTTATATPTIITKGSNNYASCQVPFKNPLIAAYALETAGQERAHVTLLRGALTTNAVAEPNLDLLNSFAGLGARIGVPGFDPFANDLTFLLGAYIFEDVGVSAYHGAAGLISDKGVLSTAAKIHAIEAYHAGLIRTTLYGLDQQDNGPGFQAGALTGLTVGISSVRATLDGTATATPPATTATPDDIPLGKTMVNLNGTTPIYTGSTIVNADVNSIGWARTTTQVLNIVYASPGATPAAGGFFPQGMNGTIK